MKGQSAVEYIMTYGWAILALIIVTVALLGSGIVSPNYLISEECNLGSNVPCNFIVYNEGGVSKISLQIFNGFQYKIRIEDLAIELKETGDIFDLTSPGSTEMESGESLEYTGTFQGSELPANSIKRFSAKITYVSCAPEISEGSACSDSEHTISGKIVARIVPE